MVIVYVLYYKEHRITLSVCFIPYLYVHSASMHNVARTVCYGACELDPFDLWQEMLAQHGRLTLLLYPSAWSVTSRWLVRPKLARNPVSATVKTQQVLSAPAFPHWRALGGMDTLAAYSTNTLHRAGKQGSPLNSTEPLLSSQSNNGHCYHCLAIQTRAGTRQVFIKDPVTLTLAIRELAFMKTMERK